VATITVSKDKSAGLKEFTKMFIETAKKELATVEAEIKLELTSMRCRQT